MHSQKAGKMTEYTKLSCNICQKRFKNPKDKFCYIRALPNKQAKPVASALFISTFGYPNKIHSDLGKEFINETVEYAEVVWHYQVKHYSLSSSRQCFC